MATDIALILTVDADGDDAIREAEAVADGLGQEGENVSVLGPVESHGGAWMGATDEVGNISQLEALLSTILPNAQVETDNDGQYIIYTGIPS